MDLVLYHNPRCSKSRRTLALLHERSLEPQVIEYLKTPPDESALRELLRKLDRAPREVLRTGEAPYSELGLHDPDIDDDTIISAMARHPILIQRPILVAGDRARIGRPPESVLEIL